LSHPVGLAIDKFNNLIVCDQGNGRLQIFGLDGRFVSKIEGNFFKDHVALWYVAVSNNGNVLVTDFNEHCFYVFH